MRAKLIHHTSEWLPGEFSPPDLLAQKPHLTVWRAHRHSKSGLIAMKVNQGTGVWDGDGHILFYKKGGADLAWRQKESELISLEIGFGKCRQREGVRHTLKRLDDKTFEPKDEMEVCVPMGPVEYLVLSRDEEKCLATWREQRQWGYVVIDLLTMSQLPIELMWPSSTISPPDFSPDGVFIVASHYYRSGWWTDEEDDYWEFPSPGGARKVGTISVHDVVKNVISYHDVSVDLPAGWIPERPEEHEWNIIWGPNFVSEREFRIWLPDDSTEVLQLPLPERIEIHKTLSIQRQWLD
jgi:hypothetical protein